MTSFDAEMATSLSSREFPFRADGGSVDATLENEFLRCQLGIRTTEPRSQRSIKGVQNSFNGVVQIFTIKAFGRTWEDAVRMWKARAK